MPVKVNIDLDLLKEMYIGQNKLLSECADYFGVSVPTVRRNLRSMGIKKPTELRGQIQGKDKIKIDIDELKRYYIDENHTRKETAEHFGVGEHIIRKRAKENGLIKSLEALEKNAQHTLLSKYGMHPAKTKEVKEKMRNTTLLHYGVANWQSTKLSKEVRDILSSEESFKKYIIESGNNTILKLQKVLGFKSESNVYVYIRKYNAELLIDKSMNRPETEISEFLDKIFVTHIKTKQVIKPYEIDFYCPDYNIGIEFNGDYWHNSLNKPKQYHFDKSKDAQNQGIRLIHIWEYEWNDPRKRPIIESMLKIAFGKIENRIYARNCEIKEITNAEAKPFNDANHLQGHRNAAVTYGLFYNNQLVQLMSFSKTKYNKNLKGDNSWEIIRGCPGSNNVVIGGVSKLFAHFVREYNPDAVFSYCDFNKFDGKGYEALGMKFIGYTGPDMKWLMPDGSVVDRSPSRHKELKEQAEAQLWGSGSKKYLWQSSNQTINNKTNN